MEYIKSQSLINQGNILTKLRQKLSAFYQVIVAIPYKSGKYSYMRKGNFLKVLNVIVAIPYKSGKYSYF